MLEKISNPNMPITAEGKTYHVGCKSGEIANRILTAGDSARIRRIAISLDATPTPFESVSARGFTVITGRYKGIPISLVAIGMGSPMMDFFVRESRAVIEGEMAIVRLGSCGSLDSEFPAGGVSVAQSAIAITTNYDYFHDSEKTQLEPYIFSKPIPANVELTHSLFKSLKSSLPASDVRSVELHAAAEFFYSTQGRTDPSFLDHNEDLIKNLKTRFPTVSTLEMETTQLFHLARIYQPNLEKKKAEIFVAATHINFIARVLEGDNATIDPAILVKLEPAVGIACLDTLIGFELKSLHPDTGSVWE